jgi:predicted GNAT family N-acyltransferase
MRTTHRSYSDEAGDFKRISHFIVQNNAAVRSHSTWCLGRFVDWKYGLWGDKLSAPGFWTQNAHLWFDGFGEVAAFAISESGGCDFALITAGGYRFLFEGMLQWALENWGDREPALSIEITALQTLEAGLLERYGFRREASFYRSGFDLTAGLVEPFPLEEGYRIVDMHAHPDYRAQRILREDAFSGRTGLSEEEVSRLVELYGYVRQSPIYHPQTDLCIMAPDGTFVAGCEALIDARNAEADIERVCTHSDYRRRGFGRVVIQECLYRLREMGMRRAYITGYSPEALGLYASLGATERTESLIYKQTDR